MLRHRLAIALSVLAVWRRPDVYEIASGHYRRFSLTRWKLLTFAAAATAITAVGRRSGDPTWDDADSILISALTFVLAPWSVGVLWQSFSRPRFTGRTAVAGVAFLVPCWAYDAYILWRDDVYPETWLPDPALSGSIIAPAGLFWNLDWREGTGGTFAFSHAPWPRASSSPPLGTFAALLAAPLVLILALFALDLLAG